MGGKTVSEACSCCGREICFVARSKENWTYKFNVTEYRRIYQCSWGCFRKEKTRFEDGNAKRYSSPTR